MKKYLYLTIVLSSLLIITGCNSTRQDKVSSHNKYNNGLKCYKELSSGEKDTFYFYFDNDDILDSFEVYAISEKQAATTYERVKEIEEIVCSGESEFKKEWLEECSYNIKGNTVEAHFYLNNGEWFEDYQTKEQIKNYDVGNLAGMSCEEIK